MNVWDLVLARIETKVNRHTFYTWFKPTSFVADDPMRLTVRVPNVLYKDWLTRQASLWRCVKIAAGGYLLHSGCPF